MRLDRVQKHKINRRDELIEWFVFGLLNGVFQGINNFKNINSSKNNRHNHAEVLSRVSPGHPSHTSISPFPISLSGISRYIDQHPLQRILTVGSYWHRHCGQVFLLRFHRARQEAWKWCRQLVKRSIL